MVLDQTIGQVAQTALTYDGFNSVMDFSTGSGLDNGGAADEPVGPPPYIGFTVNTGKLMGR